MSTTIVGFDPYVVWLNVRAEERPLGPYQLLLLEPLEANPIKVAAAVSKQLRQLESFRVGARLDVWDRVRHELEHAVGLLTNSDKKAILDASIIRKSAVERAKKSSGQKAPAGPTICCRGCQKENASQRKFCGDCGQGLWDGCSSCGAEVPVDEKFCGICGANLQATVSAEFDQARQKIADAKHLRQQEEYEGALYTLRKLAKSHDPRLDDLIEDGLALIDEIEEEIRQREQHAADALERAKMLLAEHLYDGAIADLEEVSPRFRTDEIKLVLADATAQRREIGALESEIRAAIEQKRAGDLLPKIERLLALKPSHEQALKLAAQLRDRLLILAKKKLLEHRYGEALELLRQVPSFVRSADVTKLADQAEELQWFVDDLRQSPLADGVLAELAERLVKAAPGNAEGARLKEQLAERRAKESSDPRHKYQPWAQSPKRTHLGWPIDWLTGFKSIPVPDAAHAKVFADHPGRFFTALGLALQGLDRAAVDMNLLQAEKKFSLTQFSSMLRRRPSVRSAWGLDINTLGLKAVKLQMDAKDGAMHVADVAFLKHRKMLSQPDAELEHGVLIAETLKAFLAEHPLADARVVVNMPAHKLLGRFFDLPPLELKKVPDAVEYETQHQIPYQLSELRWDWSLVTARELVEHEDSRRIVVVAGRDYHIQERLAGLREAGVQPEIMTSDCIALHNFMLYECFGSVREQTAAHDAIVTLDVGAECTNMVVTSPSVQWFRTFSTGGDSFTEPLVRQFRLTHAQAELLKREPHRARRMSAMYASLDPIVAELSSEIVRSLDSFLKLYPDQTLSRIYGVGGGFRLHGLWRALRHGSGK